MIHIAICDDEKEMGQELFGFIQNYFEQENVVGKCCIFDSASKLLEKVTIKKAWFDILLLDIEMPEVDGIELALRIREVLPEVIVIFITSYEKYVYDSFEAQPYRFIPKDRIEEMLGKALDGAIKIINNQIGKYYIVKNKDTIEKIFHKNIIYIWHKGKYCYIEKTDGTSIKVRLSLSQMYRNLDSDMFEWLDRCCICNLEHIVKIENGNVELINGEKLQVSMDRITTLKKNLLEFLHEKTAY